MTSIMAITSVAKVVMICNFAMHRRWGRWLVGFYVLAIAGGLLPLVESYSGHGVASAIVQVTRVSGADERHHLGEADDAAHHHILQDLIGALTSASDHGNQPPARVATMPTVPPLLIGSDAIRLERPPKIALSI